MADRGHPDHDVDERIGAVSSPLGADPAPVPACPAGDICAVARLASAETGDTLSSPEDPRLVPPWDLPTPQLPVAVEAASRADEDRLATALARLVAEDPTVRLERRPDTGQLLLWCVGDAHAEVLLDRLRTRHGVAVTHRARPRADGGDPRPGRPGSPAGTSSSPAATASTPSSSSRRSPGRPGSGIVFEQRIVGGTVPSQFHGSVEKGIRDAGRARDQRRPPARRRARDARRRQGALGGLLRRRLPGRRALAVRELAAAAGTQVLEPWCEIEVVVPGEYVGAVMSDLSARRARVTGSEADPVRDRTTVRAEVPRWNC